MNAAMTHSLSFKVLIYLPKRREFSQLTLTHNVDVILNEENETIGQYGINNFG